MVLLEAKVLALASDVVSSATGLLIALRAAEGPQTPLVAKALAMQILLVVKASAVLNLGGRALVRCATTPKRTQTEP